MPLSGTVCARAAAGRIPGSASAAARNGLTARRFESVAATAASADALATARHFLALVDMVGVLRAEAVAVELHRRARKLALFPGLRRRHRRAAGAHDDQRNDDDAAHGGILGQEWGSSARMRASSSSRRSSRKPSSTSITLPSASTSTELGIALTSYAAGVAPLASNTVVNRAGTCARNLSASARRLSTFTATTLKPCAAYFCCIAFIHGNDLRHGPHHDAQKST